MAWRIALLLAAALATLALGIATASILPRINVGQPTSNIFFGHIGQLGSAEEYKGKLNPPNFSFSDDLTNQIWASSKIARKKYILVGRAIGLGLASFFLMAVPWLINFGISVLSSN